MQLLVLSVISSHDALSAPRAKSGAATDVFAADRAILTPVFPEGQLMMKAIPLLHTVQPGFSLPACPRSCLGRAVPVAVYLVPHAQLSICRAVKLQFVITSLPVSGKQRSIVSAQQLRDDCS